MMSRKTGALEKAIAYHQAGKLAKAEEGYRKILRKEPDHADALHLLGVAEYQLGRIDSAVEKIRKAIRLHPRAAAYYSNLGQALERRGEVRAAVDAYRTALALQPAYPEALNNLGNALRELGEDPQAERSEALACYRRALELRPAYPEALNNLGNLLVENGRFEESLELFAKAVSLHPGYADAFYNRGFALKRLKRYGAAAEMFQKALYLPGLNYPFALDSLFEAKREECDWEGIRELEERLTAKTLDPADPTLMDPFTAAAKTTLCTPEEQYRITRKYARWLTASVEKRFVHRPPEGEGKIRVGYVTGNLYNHPTMHNIQGLFPNHDRERFHIVLFSLNHEEESPYFQNAVAGADEFVDLTRMGDRQAAEAIYEQNIHLLIDMQAYVAGARPRILAARPAPVQIQYHVYPGTMACDFIDYIVTDRVVTPPERAEAFSEKFLTMPDTYFITYDGQKVAPRKPSREECGLPEEGFAFCCFNTAHKIEPEIFAVWMEILQKSPGSLLWLFVPNPAARENLEREAEKAGVDSRRLVFAGKLPKEEHLARLSNADLFLDTYHCNAHTTAMDAVHAGVPLLTRKGERFASRVAASILTALGMEELAAESFDDYKALAIRLAGDPEAHEKIKTDLMEKKKRSPLLDTKRFVKNLETGYRMVWEHYRNGEAPREMNIERGRAS